MRAALAEARRGIGRASPNPAVGAVLVRGQRVISRGYHRASGLPHAEIECLAAAPRGSLRSATLYVTLEPCSTIGRTPPCTDAIVRAGVGRVVIGATDPNPLHSGRGIDQLRAAGIKVTTGVLAAECSRLNEAFNKWIVTGKPFVIAKCGMSLDGRLTRAPNEGRWLTGPAARRHAMQLRAQVDAILIGAETLRRDNPRLTTRGIRGARQPWRVVLSRSGKLPRDCASFCRSVRGPHPGLSKQSAPASPGRFGSAGDHQCADRRRRKCAGPGFRRPAGGQGPILPCACIHWRSRPGGARKGRRLNRGWRQTLADAIRETRSGFGRHGLSAMGRRNG